MVWFNHCPVCTCLYLTNTLNDPVDPTVLGIHDYLDIIDTPMDFGKIWRRLENGIKYMNLEDVQYIWDNCCKYNKKGSYILEFMKRVKDNFMKLWTAAGLYKEPQNFMLQIELIVCGRSTVMQQEERALRVYVKSSELIDLTESTFASRAIHINSYTRKWTAYQWSMFSSNYAAPRPGNRPEFSGFQHG